MQLAAIDGYAVCEPSVFESYNDFIASAGCIPVKGKTVLQCTYPKDIAYNIAVVSDYVFHNTKYTDCEIVKLASEKEFVNVRQGYCGCSICNVGDAIITSDMSVYKAASKLDVDCLLITGASVRLDGFDYGFIGGASFCFGDTVYFFGKITDHPDYLKIKSFCKKHGFGICGLSDDILSDYGSLIILD